MTLTLYPEDPFGALADFNIIIEKKKHKKSDCLRALA